MRYVKHNANWSFQTGPPKVGGSGSGVPPTALGRDPSSDHKAFAIWLGVDIAVPLDTTADVTFDECDEITYARTKNITVLREDSNCIDTHVLVCHDPIHYDDCTGHADSQQPWFGPSAGPKAWFVERTMFETQSEYRFAINMLGNPSQPRHYISVSPE